MHCEPHCCNRRDSLTTIPAMLKSGSSGDGHREAGGASALAEKRTRKSRRRDEICCNGNNSSRCCGISRDALKPKHTHADYISQIFTFAQGNREIVCNRGDFFLHASDSGTRLCGSWLFVARSRTPILQYMPEAFYALATVGAELTAMTVQGRSSVLITKHLCSEH